MSGPPRKRPKLTETTKAYRYEPFTKRIAKIKIDPVHKVQTSKLTDERNDLTKSFFRTALDEWTELNLTTTFTSFHNQANPLSESLPQILHHADRIVDSLLKHIEKKHELALEPLLSLVAHLAHDLGQEFAKYLERTVELVAQVAGSVQDPAAIESCFTCLAWLYKYMSKKLVQDLRPLFTILIPYMSVKKEYIRRFTAESLAYLLRKAAIMYPKNEQPLKLGLKHLFQQLGTSVRIAENIAFQNAMMTLLTESMLGVEAGLHSSAADLMRCSWRTVLQLARDQEIEEAVDVLEGTTIALIHQTDAEGFRPILNLVVSEFQSPHPQETDSEDLLLRILRAATCTRKGSRVEQWTEIAKVLINKISTSSKDAEESSAQILLEIAVAVCQYAPLEQLLPHISPMLNAIMSSLSDTCFFTFCEIVSETGAERFRDFLLEPLQKYINGRWQMNETGLCYILVSLHSKGLIHGRAGFSGYLSACRQWDKHIVSRLEHQDHAGGMKVTTAPYFQLLDAIHVAKEDSDIRALRAAIHSATQEAAQQERSDFNLITRLGLGWAFVKDVSLGQRKASDFSETIREVRREAFYLKPFLHGCKLVLEGLDKSSLDSTIPSHIVDNLVENMLTDSLELRRQSLEILSVIGRLRSDTWLSETSALLLEIIETPYLPSNARQLAMQIRKLPQTQKEVGQSTVYQRLVPMFSMSMLRHYHDQVRRDMCMALKSMAADTSTAEMIIDVAMRWLGPSRTSEADSKTNPAQDKDGYLSSFECSNLKAIRKISDGAFRRCSNADVELQQQFEVAHKLYPPQVPIESRSIALQVLLDMPEVIERRSRVLIPIFLGASDKRSDVDGPPSDNSVSSHTISLDTDEKPWTLRDRKLFLELVSKFNNPRVLYRAAETYDAMMDLLANGNTEIRKLALSVIFNWKEPMLRRYEDVLLRVAEEKTATTELATLLNNNDEDDGSIKSHDRDAVLPVLLRLLFGQLVGRGGSHGSQEAKRKAILRLLFRMEEREIFDFLRIAMGRLGQLALTEDQTFPKHSLLVDVVSADQQYGFLRMMLSIMEVLQGKFAPYGKMIVTPVVYCTVRASRQIGQDEDALSSAGALTKNIRRTGLQCIAILFEQSHDVDWFPYLEAIMDDVIRPRLPKFVADTTQGVSTLLRLISSWCSRSQLLFILREEPTLLPTLWLLISNEVVRQEVKVYVIENILGPLAEFSQPDSDSHEEAIGILALQMDHILRALTAILEHQPEKELLVTVTGIIPKLAALAPTTSTSDQILAVLITLLCQPQQKIAPHVRAGLLEATESLLDRNLSTTDHDLKNKLFEVTSSFYNYFRDIPNRLTTGKVLQSLCAGDESLFRVIQICIDLNAVSTDRLSDIDFDKRLASYTAINQIDISELSRQQVLPILHNLLFFARTAEDFSLRSNAVSCLKKVVIESCEASDTTIRDSMYETLLPAFRRGTREDSEMIRADFVMLFGLLVKYARDEEQIQDMKGLLVGGDEEASFFTNILHIQQHRRIRAIGRLITEAEKGNLSSASIADFFIPLVEKFLGDASGDDSASGTKGHSIAAIADLLKWVDWKIFRRLFRSYRQGLDATSKSEGDTVKLLSNAADALTFAVELRTQQGHDGDLKSHLARTLPELSSIGNELKEHFIPKLGKFIHHKDEAEISLRIPAAKVAVKLIKLLPEDEIPGQVTPVILDIAQILRSRAQESRDVARNTLAEIVLLLGPSSMQFVLKELRTTLNRGYQLHVLSYTMHTILLVSGSQQKSGDLDYCIDTLVAVIMDDIFGAIGQEKENQDYISAMKEVKSSKSFDSMELIARSSGVKALSRLLEPFQSLLTGALSSKQLRHIDDLLRRIGVGISHNPAASSRDLLVFAYELIQAFYKSKFAPVSVKMTNQEKNRQRYLIQLESANRSTSSSSSSHLYRLAKFSLDLVRSVILKQPALMTAENIHGFLPIIGDAVIQGQEDVRISAFRLLSAVVKLPLKEIDENASVYIMEAVKVVRSAINTNEEAAQAALKLVTALMRDRKHVEIRDADLAYLLQRTMPDLEEPDRQGVTFNFVKAVMARQIQLPEVYEIMDKVAIMMVTNHTKNARDAARGVLVHFLLDYPQSEKRWSKQVKFLLKNLDYEHPEGRQSIMEAINSLLQKLGGDQLEEFVSTFFVPIVLRMANDDHFGCREMAGALLCQLFRKSGTSQLQTLLEPLRSWATQTENETLTKLSLQAWNLFFEVNPAGANNEVPAVRSSISRHLRPSEEDDLWEVQFQALQLLSKLSVSNPEQVMTNKQREMWADVCSLLSSHHSWIQVSAAVLIEKFLEVTDIGQGGERGLTTKHGAKLDKDKIIVVLRNSIRVLKSPKGSQELAATTMKNLLFLGKWAETNHLTVEVKSSFAKDQAISDEESSEEEDSKSTISAVQYLLDQLTSILRREPNLFTAQAFLPRLSALQLLTVLVQKLSVTSIPQQSVTSLLMPLTYITDADTNQPRSADQAFPAAYNSYTEAAQLLLEALQSKLGDSIYVKLLTEASRTMRKRREERRQKRAIDRVVEPERAARDKKRKVERRKDRRKEIKDIYRKGRRRDLGF